MQTRAARPGPIQPGPPMKRGVFVALGALSLALGLIMALGTALASCLILLSFEPPSPVFQLPPATSGRPSHGSTPTFGSGLSPGEYSVDVWAEGNHGCRLVLAVPGEPVREAAAPAGERSLCRLDATARDGDRWELDAEVYGPTTGYVSVRPHQDTGFEPALLGAIGAALAIGAGLVLLVIGLRRR